MRNLSYENQFYSQFHSNVNQTHFHMKGFALRLFLKHRQRELHLNYFNETDAEGNSEMAYYAISRANEYSSSLNTVKKD